MQRSFYMYLQIFKIHKYMFMQTSECSSFYGKSFFYTQQMFHSCLLDRGNEVSNIPMSLNTACQFHLWQETILYGEACLASKALWIVFWWLYLHVQIIVIKEVNKEKKVCLRQYFFFQQTVKQPEFVLCVLIESCDASCNHGI